MPVTDGITGGALSMSAATFAASFVDPPQCYINAQIVTPSVAQTPSRPTAKAAPKGTNSTDALQQRHELEAVPKEPCEMEGHDSRPEMMTQADEVQELGLPEPSHELDGKEIQSSKVRGPSRR
ncbi:MAG: hypothetical protein LQ350_008239 [Teloschistes chrysophthalmus]|nr:MAG: hypothetical protein LQ350_008239 [Niorma chrysophthalma]